MDKMITLYKEHVRDGVITFHVKTTNPQTKRCALPGFLPSQF